MMGTILASTEEEVEAGPEAATTVEEEATNLTTERLTMRGVDILHQSAQTIITTKRRASHRLRTLTRPMEIKEATECLRTWTRKCGKLSHSEFSSKMTI